jgi:hypothetical protein
MSDGFMASFGDAEWIFHMLRNQKDRRKVNDFVRLACFSAQFALKARNMAFVALGVAPRWPWLGS